MAALNRHPRPRQTTDVLIPGALYLPRTVCSDVCLESDKNSACAGAEAPVVSVTHAHAFEAHVTLAYFREQPSASWESLPHTPARSDPAWTPTVLKTMPSLQACPPPPTLFHPLPCHSLCRDHLCSFLLGHLFQTHVGIHPVWEAFRRSGEGPEPQEAMWFLPPSLVAFSLLKHSFQQVTSLL